MRALRHALRALVARPSAYALVAATSLCACGKDPQPVREAEHVYAPDGRLLLRPSARVARPNLIVIVIDTLRADELGQGDAARGRMPWLEGLALRGTRFTQASATSPWTVPSMTSLFTGMTPNVHGGDGESGTTSIDPAVTTFAEALHEGYGYATMAFVGGPWMGGDNSMFAGFNEVVQGFALQGMERVLWPWARGRDRTQPFFLLLHTYEAHHPYGAANHPFPIPPTGAVLDGPDLVEALGEQPSTSALAELLLTSLAGGQSLLNRHRDQYLRDVTRFLWRGLKEAPDDALTMRLKAAYDGGVSWVDGLLKTASERLREWGLLDNTLLVVTADHGEAFGEHGVLMHGRDCHDELLRVPLVLEGLAPFQGGQRVEGSMALMDLLPTFFDANGMPPLEGIQGRSALPLLRAGGGGWPVESEEWVTPGKTGGDGPIYVAALRSTQWKVILSRDPAGSLVKEEAYDLAKDPLEKQDLATEPGGAALLPFDEPFRTALETLRRRVLSPLVVPRAPPNAGR